MTKTKAGNGRNEETKQFKIYGVDGEGYFNTEEESHFYDVFTCGANTIDGEGYHLEITDIVSVIREATFESLEEGYKPLFIGYFYNYDFTQMIRSLDDFQLTRLYERSVRTRHAPKNKKDPKYKRAATITTPVNIEMGNIFSPERFKLDYLEGKYLEFSFPIPETLTKARFKQDEGLIRWVKARVQDVGTIFGASFIKALESFKVPMTEQEKIELEKGKATRANNNTFEERAEAIDEIISYNKLEISLVYRLIATLVNTLRSLNVEIDLERDLSGIGSIAARYLKERSAEFHILPSYEIAEVITPEFYQVANDSYFGGWAETLRPGIHYNMEQADITSAYPDVMRNLPDLTDAKIKKVYSYAEAVEETLNGSIVYADIEFFGSNDFCGPLMFRTDDGNVVRPQFGRGKYLISEIMAADRAGLLSEITMYEGWVITPVSSNKPFRYMEQLFNERIAIGKKSVQGQMIKLILNSQYGKLAQSVGNPMFANPVYASMITAGARIKILDAIATHPKGVNALAAVATDAVFFTDPHPNLDLSLNTLGAWEKTHYPETFLMKPGIWGGIEEDGNSDVWSLKTRGVSYGSMVEKLKSHILPSLKKFEEDKVWDENVSFETINTFSMLTLGEAYTRNQLDRVGEFMVGQHGIPELIRSVRFNLSPKRSGVEWVDGLGFISHTPIQPFIDGEIPVSKPYNKLIGNVDFDTV